MKNYHETTDGLIVPFEKIALMKSEVHNKNIRVVFDNGCEENLDDDELKIVKQFKLWLNHKLAIEFSQVSANLHSCTDGSMKQMQKAQDDLNRMISGS